ncbi:hypothetical protein AK966_09215 [Vibrio sp. PID23_8]|nr:hypothetical protein AK966_09215 [Vibrio sp. PID23_8]
METNLQYSKSITKLEKCLIAFLEAGTFGLRTIDVLINSKAHANDMDRANRFWSSCLRDDVSKLRNTYNIHLSDKVDPFVSLLGYKANFKRYWISNLHEAEKVITLLNQLRKKRGKSSLSAFDTERFLSKFN